MPRLKQYNTEEVLEKAMHLFWKNGYENTSVRMLEQEMGINQFSIYSSFGSKEGVFLESIKNYKKCISNIVDVLRNSNNGLKGIKDYFYDFLVFSNYNKSPRGCLITNTANENISKIQTEIATTLTSFTQEIKEIFILNLKQEKGITTSDIDKIASYLLISLMSLANASRLYKTEELHNYIEHTFKNI